MFCETQLEKFTDKLGPGPAGPHGATRPILTQYEQNKMLYSIASSFLNLYRIYIELWGGGGGGNPKKTHKKKKKKKK